MDMLIDAISENWLIWFVTIVLIVAAIIDGAILKVPNWLTFPFIASGLVYWTIQGGVNGLAWSFAGMAVGTVLLLVLRNVGGMGAGDVKLLAGVGAWVGTLVTLKVFAATAIVGGIMAMVMILRSGNWFKHYAMARQILDEWRNVRNPSKLSKIARERKPTMTLLPYGIPMAIGAVIYFATARMLI
ncbi:A24 family peptidase [Stieleria varia]|uniref:Type IV leader peptidase family protein n=1 Tax=Stieleria varia TaxID=2528005 RepID=A0A5C6ATN8_9BACT|nr:A24 family peptidase [Stieleria varia]TWU02771.1 Type IV leader peptidase family protein [Stieleria varia]